MAGLNGIGSAASGLGSLNVNSASSTAETQAVERKAPLQGQLKVAEPADKAEVSSTGGLVAQALGTSDVRHDKVAALHAAITNGSYHVDASAVANKLLDHLLK